MNKYFEEINFYDKNTFYGKGIFEHIHRNRKKIRYPVSVPGLGDIPTPIPETGFFSDSDVCSEQNSPKIAFWRLYIGPKPLNIP
jgi:hypothetical protein